MHIRECGSGSSSRRRYVKNFRVPSDICCAKKRFTEPLALKFQENTAVLRNLCFDVCHSRYLFGNPAQHVLKFASIFAIRGSFWGKGAKPL
jgi:hypothetical protein